MQSKWLLLSCWLAVLVHFALALGNEVNFAHTCVLLMYVWKNKDGVVLHNLRDFQTIVCVLKK